MFCVVILVLIGTVWSDQKLSFSNAALSSIWEDRIASNLIDGNYSTYGHSLCSTNGAELWLKLDLKRFSKINRLRLYPTHLHEQKYYERPDGTIAHLVRNQSWPQLIQCLISSWSTAGEALWRGGQVWCLQVELERKTCILRGGMSRESCQQRSYLSATKNWTSLSSFFRDWGFRSSFW